MISTNCLDHSDLAPRVLMHSNDALGSAQYKIGSSFRGWIHFKGELPTTYVGHLPESM